MYSVQSTELPTYAATVTTTRFSASDLGVLDRICAVIWLLCRLGAIDITSFHLTQRSSSEPIIFKSTPCPEMVLGRDKKDIKRKSLSNFYRSQSTKGVGETPSKEEITCLASLPITREKPREWGMHGGSTYLLVQRLESGISNANKDKPQFLTGKSLYHCFWKATPSGVIQLILRTHDMGDKGKAVAHCLREKIYG